MIDKSRVTELFDKISPQYDRTNRVLSLGLDLYWRKMLAKHLPKTGPLKLLDVASGTGDQISALFDKGAFIEHAVGIDLSSGMLALAEKKFTHLPYSSKVSFQQANAEALPFPNTLFDVCTCSFGIRNMQRPITVLKELYRVTKPLGRCLILEFSLPTNWFRLPYLFYLRFILPHVGALLAKDRAAYRYLNQTIEEFASGTEFLAWMTQAGWNDVQAIHLFFGSVTLYRGEKN